MISRYQMVLLSVLLVFSLATQAKLSTNNDTAIEKGLESKKDVTTESSVEENLATIEVTGVDSELKKNIELHMPVTIPECTVDRGEIKQFFTTVKKHLRKASRALGYYDAELRSGGKIENGCWKLRLRITPGRPTKISSQVIKVVGEGSNDKLFKKILENSPYEKGDVLNHKKYSDFKTSLSEAAQSLGYFDAEFLEHSIKINPTAYKASVVLVLDTGKRYRYGKISVEQNILSDGTLKNFLLIKTGQPFKTEELINQQQFLQQSGYFQLITVEVQHNQIKDFQVPIKISLTSKKRNAYKFKVGYGSDTGGRVAVEMNRRWTGTQGKQFKVSAQYAQNLSGVSLKLISPRKNPQDDSLVYNIDWQKDKNDDVTSKAIDIGGKYTRKRDNGWIQSASISLLLDRTQVEGEESNKSKLLLFGVGLEKVKADNLLYPDDGWRLKLGLKTALKSFVSDQNVTQAEILGKRIMRLGEGRLIGRLHLGSTIVNDFDRLPKRLRFFAGGGNSVRGYTFESLGEEKIVNKKNRVIGGKNLLELSLEYQHPITDEWSAAAFIDAGNAFNDWSNYEVKVGVGFGARYKSPIGPVRIDLGFPKENFKKPHLYLSVGSEL